jgi:hypothetical protein
MNNIKTHLTWFLITLFFATSGWLLLTKYRHERNDRLRLERSYKAANSKIEYYRTLNNELVAKTEILQLKISEVKDLYPEIIAEIRNLRIKPGRVEQYSETVIHQNKDISTVLRDSIIYDTIPVRVFNYKDEFYTVSGIAIGDTQHVHIESRDSLIQVVYRGKRYKPWLWVFSRRRLEQVVRGKNPENKIEYSRFIFIE